MRVPTHVPAAAAVTAMAVFPVTMSPGVNPTGLLFTQSAWENMIYTRKVLENLAYLYRQAGSESEACACQAGVMALDAMLAARYLTHELN